MLSYFSLFLVFLIAIVLLARAFLLQQRMLNLVILQEEKSNAVFYNILWPQVTVKCCFLFFEHFTMHRVSWSHPAPTVLLWLPQTAQHISSQHLVFAFKNPLNPISAGHMQMDVGHTLGDRQPTSAAPPKQIDSLLQQPETLVALQIGVWSH